MSRQSKTLVPDNVVLAEQVVGTSPAIWQIRAWIDQVSKTVATVLILGESGTGKERVAKAIHGQSMRASGPFVPVNCGAIPGDLLETELFGHEKGAFTGASSQRRGRIELAHQGTLFLDEIGDMPLLMQVKLLRVLQERCFERVGGHQRVHSDFRVLAATHQNLQTLVDKGLFREDLFYRLNVFPIALPPLRDRREDIPLLIKALLSDLQTRGYPMIQLAPELMGRLSAYEWPGNIRELMNRLERLCILYPGQTVQTDPWLTVSQSQFQSQDPDSKLLASEKGMDLNQYLTGIEKQLIQQALKHCGGVVLKAAAYLNIKRTTLIEKMRRYQLHV